MFVFYIFSEYHDGFWCDDHDRDARDRDPGNGITTRRLRLRL
jgi:hypothetical protein